MTSKVCGGCRRTIFVNENGSLYEDVTRHRYHTKELCLAGQLARLRPVVGAARRFAETHTMLGPEFDRLLLELNRFDSEDM
jgi:hypothetical protein